MIITNPRKHLLIFSGSNDQIYEYVRSNNISSYYDSRNIIYIGSECSMRGFCDVDVLFIYGWWNKSGIDSILGTIGIYMRRGRSRVLGDEKYIPPYLWQLYREMGCTNCDITGNDTISRFEMLDIR